jgi:beta-glucosidase-like glycosyl hydrolase
VNGRFAVQYVQGLQGSDNYLKAVATCKHSLLYDLEQSRSENSLHATPRDITEYFIVPFEFCIKRAKVAAIMCQYGAMDGVPSCANGKINNELYRDMYHWDGYMISDCDAVRTEGKWLPKSNNTNQTAREETVAAMLGGLDVDCGTTYEAITAAVAQGFLPEAAVRNSTRRFLTAQIGLGAFDANPYSAFGPEMVDNPEHRALALEAALQALVLLRNEPVSTTPLASSSSSSSSRGNNGNAEPEPKAGMHVQGNPPALPISASSKLALLGPHATSTVGMLGNYHGVNLHGARFFCQKLTFEDAICSHTCSLDTSACV